MAIIDLKYGLGALRFEYDASRFDVLGAGVHRRPLSDVEIGEKLDAPIDSPLLEEIVNPGETVLIVVPDATRQVAAGQIVNLLVRRLIANGTTPFEISIIFATGIHRKVTESERVAILTPFIAQRIKTLDHDPRDLMQIVDLGETSGGIPIQLNRALVENDHVILVGGVSFHYFAGFTGGRKLICPGLASSRTVSETHRLAFDCERLSSRAGVDTGRLDGNPVHEAFMDAVGHASPAFAITTEVDEAGELIDLFCGNWITSHRAACRAFAVGHTLKISEKRDLVIASCGGSPHDVNVIQAHKTLDAATRSCNDGGTVVLLAECPEGSGRQDFMNWFEAETSRHLAENLCQKYQVNGQTAWNLLRKAEKFDVRMVTALDAEAVKKMRLTKINKADVASLIRNAATSAYILPNGGKFAVSE